MTHLVFLKKLYDLVNATRAKLSGPPETATTYFFLFNLSSFFLKLKKILGQP